MSKVGEVKKVNKDSGSDKLDNIEQKGNGDRGQSLSAAISKNLQLVAVISSEISKMEQELQKMDPNSSEYKKLKEGIEKNRKIIKEIEESIKRQQAILSGLLGQNEKVRGQNTTSSNKTEKVQKINDLLKRLDSAKPGKQHDEILNELDDAIKDMSEFKKLKEVLEKNKEGKDRKKGLSGLQEKEKSRGFCLGM